MHAEFEFEKLGMLQNKFLKFKNEKQNGNNQGRAHGAS
jgi:hypothetical protein